MHLVDREAVQRQVAAVVDLQEHIHMVQTDKGVSGLLIASEAMTVQVQVPLVPCTYNINPAVA